MLIQLIGIVGKVVARSVADAYQQTIRNANISGAAANALPTSRKVLDAIPGSMQLEEAAKILNVSTNASKEQVLQVVPLPFFPQCFSFPSLLTCFSF